MHLSDLLDDELLMPKTVCTSKDEIINKLIERIYGTKLEFPLLRQEMTKTIYIRELIGGTVLPSGLAIPHARIKNYKGFILALGTPAGPIFQDGIQIRMIALMITSQSGSPWYLPVLGALTKLSRDSAYFSRLYGAETTEKFKTILKERDAELD